MKTYTHILLWLLGLITLALPACDGLDDHYATNPAYRLTFSTDTLAFDTIFSSIGSTTKQLMVYNPNDEPLRVETILLASGESTGFRINVDGRKGSAFNGVNILERDSMYIFVEVTVDPNGGNQPLLIQDSILFQVNGNRQSVLLEAYGQDVHLYKGGKTFDRDTVLPADKPYLIYDSLVVAPGATLQLDPGTRLHFHNRASLLVQGRLQAEGTQQAPIQIRGDRLDRLFADLPYDNLGGQWGGIRFYPESTGNVISHAYVRGMSSGIVLDSCATEEMRLEIANSRIRNSSGNLITSKYSRLYCWNSELSDAAGAVLSLTGGVADFTHCTIVNYYFYDVITAPIVTLGYCAAADSIQGGAPLLRASFNNSILCGKASEVSGIDFTGSHVFFRSCLFNSMGEDDANFIHTVWGGMPLFKATGEEHYYYNYQIGSEESGAIGKGDPAFALSPLDKDMYGNSRLERVDIGAYQYVPQAEVEE